jgi:hypothetical protein
VGKVAKYEVNVARYEGAQQVYVSSQAIKLGEHHGGANGFRVRESLRKLGPITALAALGFHVLGYERPTATVEVALDSHALRFEPEATAALPVGTDSEIRNEFALSH